MHSRQGRIERVAAFVNISLLTLRIDSSSWPHLDAIRKQPGFANVCRSLGQRHRGNHTRANTFFIMLHLLRDLDMLKASSPIVLARTCNADTLCRLGCL